MRHKGSLGDTAITQKIFINFPIKKTTHEQKRYKVMILMKNIHELSGKCTRLNTTKITRVWSCFRMNYLKLLVKL